MEVTGCAIIVVGQVVWSVHRRAQPWQTSHSITAEVLGRPYTPYFLVFGRHPRLAIDVYLGVELEGEGESLTEYVQEIKNRLRYAYELASKEAIN